MEWFAIETQYHQGLSVAVKQQSTTEISGDGTRKRSKAGSAPFSEVEIWQAITRDWRKIYGGFYDCGVSIEWHDFEVQSQFEWSRAFHPESLELCLNISGCGTIVSSAGETKIQPLSAAFYFTGGTSLKASRRAQERHRFVTLEFSPGFLRTHLADRDGALHPVVETALRSRREHSHISEAHPLKTAHQQLITQFLHPPVAQGARRLWFEAKILELMSEFFFERVGEDELFCDHQKRMARERVDRALDILRRELAEPPSLEELGRRVGCSQFHLSRIFSKEMGMTIPQFLRRARMERAADLLASGKCNVTEAALEVGYASMSHFSQAFCQTMGCCPNLYPHAKALQQSLPISPTPPLPQNS